MGDVFFEILQSSDLSLTHLKNLSDIFNMSVEATFIRAVKLEIRPCALLSLKLNEDDDKNFLNIRYVVYSGSFIKLFNKVDYRQTFSKEHTFSSIVTDPMKNLFRECECDISFGSGDKKKYIRAQLWKNNWNIFVLLLPDYSQN